MKTQWYQIELYKTKVSILQTTSWSQRCRMQALQEYKALSIFLKLISWRNWFWSNHINMLIEILKHTLLLKCPRNCIRALNLLSLKSVLKLLCPKAIRKWEVKIFYFRARIILFHRKLITYKICFCKIEKLIKIFWKFYWIFVSRLKAWLLRTMFQIIIKRIFKSKRTMIWNINNWKSSIKFWN